MEYEKGVFPTAGVPMGAVVTASGTGAEMNSGAVITYEEKLWKGPIVGTAAAFAVLSPRYTATVPTIQVFSGAFDTLSHAMETYLGNSDQDNVSDDVALAIMRNTVTNMRRLMVDAQDMQLPDHDTAITIADTGEAYTWRSPMHCLLLVGYTDTAYLFHDPLQGGAIAYEKNQVLAAYRAMGEMALVIRA